MTIDQLVDEYGLAYCVECGKCVAACPMGEIFRDFSYEASPRGVIERALLGADFTDNDRLWFCLTCNLCTDLCPAGVRFRDFVQAARQSIIQAGVAEHGAFCRNCGVYLWPRHTVEYMKQTLGNSAEELVMLCPRCRQYDMSRRVKTPTLYSPVREASSR